MTLIGQALNNALETQGWVIPVVIAILGGGLFTGIAILLKARPERDKIVVDAAQGAVIVQSNVIRELKYQLDEQKEKITQLENQLNDIFQENEKLKKERNKLSGRIRKLEKEIHG